MVNPPVGRKGERSCRHRSGSVSLSRTSLLDVLLALSERPESQSRGQGDVTLHQRPSASVKQGQAGGLGFLSAIIEDGDGDGDDGMAHRH